MLKRALPLCLALCLLLAGCAFAAAEPISEAEFKEFLEKNDGQQLLKSSLDPKEREDLIHKLIVSLRYQQGEGMPLATYEALRDRLIAKGHAPALYKVLEEMLREDRIDPPELRPVLRAEWKPWKVEALREEMIGRGASEEAAARAAAAFAAAMLEGVEVDMGIFAEQMAQLDEEAFTFAYAYVNEVGEMLFDHFGDFFLACWARDVVREDIPLFDAILVRRARWLSSRGASENMLRMFFGAVDDEWGLVYQPGNPKPYHVLTVEMSDWQRDFLQEGAGGRLVFTRDPDEASILVLDREAHSLAGYYDGVQAAYATDRHLYARSLTQEIAPFVISRSSNAPPSMKQSAANPDVPYVMSAPEISRTEMNQMGEAMLAWEDAADK